MSTKTTFKRVALVAVASLGFGVLTSVAPANAAAVVTAITAGTSAPARVSVTGGATTITLTYDDTVSNTETITAQITSAPATSVAAALTLTNATGGVDVEANDVASDVTDQLNTSATAAAGTGVAASTFTSTSGKTSDKFVVNLKADVAGTYQILVSAGGNTVTGYGAGAKAVAFSITTTGAPVSVTAAAVAGSAVEGGTYGQIFSASLKDANGNATVLGLNESIAISATTGVALKTLALGALTSLEKSTDVAGVYYFRAVENVGSLTANSTSVVTLTGAGLLSATLTTNTTATIKYTTASNTAAAVVTLTDAENYDATGGVDSAANGSVSSSHSFTVTAAAVNTPTADEVRLVTVTPLTTVAFAYDTVMTLAKAASATAKGTGTFTVAQALASTNTTKFSVLVSDAATAAITIGYKAPAVTTLAITSGKSILSATGATNKFTAIVKNQYGTAMQYAPVTVTVSGRNTAAAKSLGVTDANGIITFSLTDAGTTGTSDKITLDSTSPASDSATITYGTVAVSTVTVTGGATADTVAGTTKTAISGADNGPEASAVTIKAVVKDASGNLLAGVPVTFTVDAGAIVKSASVDYTTVYTGSDGSASTKAFNWLVGKQTVTATAGGVAKAGHINWVATDATSARVLSATATGDIVSLKVVDRFGNAVAGVAIDLSRTGTGLFGSGKSADSVTTDKSGTADIRFIGSGTVVAELDSAVYTQSADVAGEIDAEAATAAVAGTTKGTGASLAPAGVAKVSVAISEGADPIAASSQAAADAAAEATDAANAATDAANAAAEAADAATAAAQDAADAVAALSTQVSEMVNALKKQITALTNLVIKIQKKVRA